MVASSLDEVKAKSADKFGKTDDLPNIHLDSDGTEIDDEDYFQTLEPNAELIAVFAGEQWMDVSIYINITKIDSSIGYARTICAKIQLRDYIDTFLEYTTSPTAKPTQ